MPPPGAAAAVEGFRAPEDGRPVPPSRNEHVRLALPLLQLDGGSVGRWATSLGLLSHSWSVTFETESRLWVVPGGVVLRARLALFWWEDGHLHRKHAERVYRALALHVTRTHGDVAWPARGTVNIYARSRGHVRVTGPNPPMPCLCVAENSWRVERCGLCRGGRTLVLALPPRTLHLRGRGPDTVTPGGWSSPPPRLSAAPLGLQPLGGGDGGGGRSWVGCPRRHHSTVRTLLGAAGGGGLTVGQWRRGDASRWVARALDPATGKSSACTVHGEPQHFNATTSRCTLRCADLYTPCRLPLPGGGGGVTVTAGGRSAPTPPFPTRGRVWAVADIMRAWVAQRPPRPPPSPPPPDCCAWTRCGAAADGVVFVPHPRVVGRQWTAWLRVGCPHAPDGTAAVDRPAGYLDDPPPPRGVVCWEAWSHPRNLRPYFVLEWWGARSERESAAIASLVRGLCIARGLPAHDQTHGPHSAHVRWVMQGTLNVHECQRMTLVVVLRVTAPERMPWVRFTDLYGLRSRGEVTLARHPSSLLPSGPVAGALHGDDAVTDRRGRWFWEAIPHPWPRGTSLTGPQWGECSDVCRLCLFRESNDRVDFCRVRWAPQDPQLRVRRRRPLFPLGYGRKRGRPTSPAPPRPTKRVAAGT